MLEQRELSQQRELKKQHEDAQSAKDRSEERLHEEEAHRQYLATRKPNFWEEKKDPTPKQPVGWWEWIFG